jgi:hypothetical protein
MRKEKEPERKSARLEKKRKVPTPSVSPRRGELFAEVEIEDSVLVTPPGKTSSTPRSGSSDLNPDRQDPYPEGETTGSEQGCHKGRNWRKITVRTSFSSGRPRTSSGRPRLPRGRVFTVRGRSGASARTRARPRGREKKN